MRKQILILFLFLFLLSCERPQRFDFDEFLGSPDDDSEVSDFDMNSGDTGDTGDDEDLGNTGDSGNTADLDSNSDSDSKIDGDSADLDADFSDFDSDYGVLDTDFPDNDSDNDNDYDQPDEDIIVLLYCGDSTVQSPEICDKNTTTCNTIGGMGYNNTAVVDCNSGCNGWITADCTCSNGYEKDGTQKCVDTNECDDEILNTCHENADCNNTSGSYTCTCKTNYSGNGFNCTADTRVNQNCTGLPSNAVWNTATVINQTWSGTAWMPSTTGVYNTTLSTIECHFKCNTNYTWDPGSSTCVADTRSNQSCTGLPLNAVWNTASSITQTWIGSAWTPTTVATYNPTGSTTECRYQCSPNYRWTGSACVLACPSNLILAQWTGTSDDGWLYEGHWYHNNNAMVWGSTTIHSIYDHSLTYGTDINLSGCSSATLLFQISLSDDATWELESSFDDKNQKLYIECSSDGGETWYNMIAPILPTAQTDHNGCTTYYCDGTFERDRSFNFTGQTWTTPEDCLTEMTRFRFRANGSEPWELNKPGWTIDTVIVNH